MDMLVKEKKSVWHDVWVMPGDLTMIDVIAVINEMPVTKNCPVISLRKIDHTRYLEDVRAVKENFFLQMPFEGKEAL
ncbi:hypothetical protein [Exiguobacterium sp. KJ 601]|uniref:hypothetical protein n=1 Tax=Exiguobacterium sp. KJ 601 TaxID=2782569 RepID=UPI0022AFAFEF|nr:hypothetical protein [Exiguobacterium sp. KJ 601]